VAGAPEGAQPITGFLLQQEDGERLQHGRALPKSHRAVMRVQLPIRGVEYGKAAVSTLFYEEDGMRKLKCEDYYLTCSKRVVKVSIFGRHAGAGAPMNSEADMFAILSNPGVDEYKQYIAGLRNVQQQPQQQQQRAGSYGKPPTLKRSLAQLQASAAGRAARQMPVAQPVIRLAVPHVAAAVAVCGNSLSEEEAAAARQREDGLAALAATVAGTAAEDAARAAGLDAALESYGLSLVQDYEVRWRRTYLPLIHSPARIYTYSSFVSS
jgi:hypothetical protein